ncbi:MAG: glycoside hydrolase family 28 protein [Bacteroidaceae bacterium]|nr:glycoside hydrolase family 28 protein [Bacteroidaceae bacterium]
MKMIKHKLSLLLLMIFAVTSSFAAVDEAKVAAKRDAILKNIVGAKQSPDQKTVSIVQFGAKGNGKNDCKPAFDKAMKKAEKTKGGLHIVVPKGVYYINGPINLVSNIVLEIQQDAVLKFSDNPDSYPLVETSWEGTYVMNYSPFIYGKGLSDVSIIGNGTIDGNALETFGKWKPEGKQTADQMLSREMNHKELPVKERVFGKGHFLRPQMIQFFMCKNVTVDGLKMTNSPFWCLHLLQVDNAIVKNLSFKANKILNNNGVTLEYASNILVEGCHFCNVDDNVVVKCGRDNDGWTTNIPSRNIVVRKCQFKGLHAFVCGSEVSAGIQDVFVEDCSFAGYCKRGFYIKTNPDRGGYVRNIYINNCEFGEVYDLLFVTSVYSGEGLRNNYFSDVHDIHVRNVRCKKARNAAFVLQGSAVRPVYNVSLNNVEVDEAKHAFTFDYTKNIEISNTRVGEKIEIPTSLTDDEMKDFE